MEQTPVGQVPVSQVGQEAGTGEEPPSTAANTESSFRGFSAPHSGQGGADSEKLLARCSKRVPHLLQVYS